MYEPACKLAQRFMRAYTHTAVQDLEQVAALMDMVLCEDTSVSEPALSSLFTGIIEPLADSYRSDARTALVQVMAHVIMRTANDSRHYRARNFAARLRQSGIENERQLVARVHERSKCQRAAFGKNTVRKVIHLSRVTLGADILFTGVAMKRMRWIYPKSEQIFVGPVKNGALFCGDKQTRLREIKYPRIGSLADRFCCWLDMVNIVEEECREADGDVLVLNLDSRILQSGLLPVLPLPCEKTHYFFWEPSDRINGQKISLYHDLIEWLNQTFGPAPKEDVRRPIVYLDPDEQRFAGTVLGHTEPANTITVNFGTGENPRKRVHDGRGAGFSFFERDIVLGLLEQGMRVVLDKGAEPDEMEYVGALVKMTRKAGWPIIEIGQASKPVAASHGPALVALEASVSRLGAFIAACGLYVGYDSLGHHLGAALGRDVIAVFAGYDHPAFPDFWRPMGSDNIHVVRAGPGPFTQAEQSNLAKHVLDIIRMQRKAE